MPSTYHTNPEDALEAAYDSGWRSVKCPGCAGGGLTMYGLNQNPARPLHPGDQFSTPDGVLTVSIADGNVTLHDPDGNVVPVYLSAFRYTAHCRANGRQVWPPVEVTNVRT